MVGKQQDLTQESLAYSPGQFCVKIRSRVGDEFAQRRGPS